MKNIGILTSGGDCPGMNAVVRSFVRTCLYNGITPFGIEAGAYFQDLVLIFNEL
ncbi:hypothetical protein AGMMS49941_11650 [Deferribacterales bacterium]|nr:hypothetical protein AGMMS49941_11650 [Deferribacterales bacterium]